MAEAWTLGGSPRRAAAPVLGALLLALGLAAAMPPAPASAGALETDQDVLAADRILRAAELRPDSDPLAMDLYRQAGARAKACLARNPNSAAANFVYFAAEGRILLADGLARNLMTLRALQRDHLDRAITLDRDYANALAAKGGVLLDLPVLLGGDPDEGLRLLTRAMVLNPGGVGTRVTYAKALARAGEMEKARLEARRAAHYACMQGRIKALDQAVALLDELGPGGAVVRAGLR